MPKVCYIIAIYIFSASIQVAAEDPWADTVESSILTNPFTGYDAPSSLLGAPIGISASVPVNTLASTPQVLGLGVPTADPRAWVTVSFDTPIQDGANNYLGLDFIIYSNAFWVGGNEQIKFKEPAIVEISPDGANWYLIPGSRAYDYTNGDLPLKVEASGANNSTDSDYLAGTITNPNGNTTEYNWGYAELSPTLVPYLDNYVRPDDPNTTGMTARSGGGDVFDIAWAIDQNRDLVNLTTITHIRISPFIDRNGSTSPEIMAIADVAPNIDTDGDGILDDYETRVIGTDPNNRLHTMLPLEIPSIEGGSAIGTILAELEDNSGNKITLTSSTSPRTSDTLYTIVDITNPTRQQ